LSIGGGGQFREAKKKPIFHSSHSFLRANERGIRLSYITEVPERALWAPPPCLWVRFVFIYMIALTGIIKICLIFQLFYGISIDHH
jgi:hypothetical protein